MAQTNGYFFDKSGGNVYRSETSTFKYALNQATRGLRQMLISLFIISSISPSNSGAGLELDETNAAGAVYTIEILLIRSGSARLTISFIGIVQHCAMQGQVKRLIYDVRERYPMSLRSGHPVMGPLMLN
jgi:spore maturation protein SpmA